jgi:ATP-dependent helicase/nuclease subunit B
VFTIPPSAAFVDHLAQGLREDAGDDPLSLARVTVLLPTRRAARALREAFLRLTDGKPLLLPRMMPLNDVDSDETLFGGFAGGLATDLPPPLPPLRRQLLLARLIGRVPSEDGRPPRPEQAIMLAAELARLLDQVQTEGLDFARLKDLAPDRYAAHWQITLRFLEIVTEAWPGVLRDEGAIDPADHRNRVFAAQARIWAAGAPGPIVAAGSTGSIPATAALLATVAHLPEGCVILPGLDKTLDPAAWDVLDESHPQYGLKTLLACIGMDRDAVAPWPTVPEATRPTPRERLVSECMRPAETTDRWTDPRGPLADLPATAVKEITRLDCAGPREEAETVALIMRGALEEPGRTCALVTPDRGLAERVAAELERWDVAVDDSAGRPLHRTPPGAFLRLTAAMVADAFAPVATLAACKHPLAAVGLDPVRFRDLTRAAERALLRGPRPPAGLAGLGALARQVGDVDATAWVSLLADACGGFAAVMSGGPQPLRRLLDAHMALAERLAATPEIPGPLRLWRGEDGEAAAAFVAELAQGADALPLLEPAAYPAVLEALMAGRVVRPRYGRHPRLAILGPLEARLQRFDVLILAGLNEGTWPAEPPPDPWMSRPMRQAFGLPSPERRIGLAAHDIAQAMCAPRVILTRSLKVDGTPTVPSRWLMRLERAVAAARLDWAWRDESNTWPEWARILTRPARVEPLPAPAPTPPVPARPRRLSVTEIEKWMRDPYAIYARHVLGLQPLDPLEQDASAADYGALIHDALEAFVAAHPAGPLPQDAHERLIAAGRAVFAMQALRPGIAAFWWPRFARVADWFLARETERRALVTRSWVEVEGTMTLPAPGGPFVLTGRADRIDRLPQGVAIIDYKTGKPPSSKEVLAGYAPQLPLEAAMIAAGGFPAAGRANPAMLAFWHLHGRGDGGEVVEVKGDPIRLAEESRARLEALIAAFDRRETPYRAQPNPDMAPAYSDYLHLARVKEWGTAGGGGEG